MFLGKESKNLCGVLTKLVSLLSRKELLNYTKV